MSKDEQQTRGVFVPLGDLALNLALLAFKRTYNEQWMLEKYHYRSPAQVRRDLVGLAKAA